MQISFLIRLNDERRSKKMFVFPSCVYIGELRPMISYITRYTTPAETDVKSEASKKRSHCIACFLLIIFLT